MTASGNQSSIGLAVAAGAVVVTTGVLAVLYWRRRNVRAPVALQASALLLNSFI